MTLLCVNVDAISDDFFWGGRGTISGVAEVLFLNTPYVPHTLWWIQFDLQSFYRHPAPEPTVPQLSNLYPLVPDSKAKVRAVDAGVALGIARALASRLPEMHMISVRVRMLISDLLQMPDMQVELKE